MTTKIVILIGLEALGSEGLVIDIVDVLVEVAELVRMNGQVLSVLHWQGEL